MMPGKVDKLELTLYLNDRTIKNLVVEDFRNTEAQYAKKNIDEMTLKQKISYVFDTNIINIGKDNICAIFAQNSKSIIFSPSIKIFFILYI